MSGGAKYFLSTCGNIPSNFFGYQLTYVVEACDWSIKNDGQSIIRELNKRGLFRARISYSSLGLRNQIIHFGSANTFFRSRLWQKPHPSNRCILTWFHVVPHDDRLKLIRDVQHILQCIHTSCEITKKTLVDAGVDERKIVVIPLGVDLGLFRPGTKMERSIVRKELGIPEERIVIGSFQKDGVGWGDGREPKLIKGPDVFVDVIEGLRDHKPFVLLTGPARGYIKSELKKRGICYKHIYLKNFHDLHKMYHALDLYLITSRVEGGPKSLLEAWASGVPVVSTRVGMVPDISKNEETTMLANVEDSCDLIKCANRLLRDYELQERIVTNACHEVHRYDWNRIVQRYYESLYQPLL